MSYRVYRNIFVVMSIVLISVACSEQTNDAMSTGGGKKETAVEHATKHLDPTYVCPMHPNIVKNEPGSCPICGMDLVLKEPEEDMASAEQKILYYRHPHNPTITSDKPMKDEMGMDYIPIYDDRGGTSVKISPAVENNMGVRTALAEKDRLWRKIDTVGYVDVDENRISHIHLRTKGWIDKLMVKSDGERVKKGQLLFEVYSPELVNAQEEYLQALSTSSRRLISASKERLAALGVSDVQINSLNKTRKVTQYVQVYAPQDGIVDKLSVREGMFVMPQVEVMSLADLSSIWILAEVFERQVDWIQAGLPAEVSLSYLPGRTWEGKVEYVYPALNQKTRTLKVRLRFDNPDESLKPNMFANVTIYAGPTSDTVVIPREALIRTGDEERVILSMGKGRYQPRKVIAGIESGDYVEIQRGLAAGDRVVTSGQFLIDSEASLKASLQRMSLPGVPIENEPESITGTGILREILAGENKVNMTHDPIPAIKWPETTMYFKVKPNVKLDGFKPEDKVMFELEKTGDAYIIKSMHKHDGMGGM